MYLSPSSNETVFTKYFVDCRVNLSWFRFVSTQRCNFNSFTNFVIQWKYLILRSCIYFRLLSFRSVKNYVTDYTNAKISKKKKRKKNKEKKNRNVNSLDVKNNCAQTFLYSSLVNHVGRYFYIFTEIYRAGMIFRVKYPPGKQFDEILPGGYDF